MAPRVEPEGAGALDEVGPHAVELGLDVDEHGRGPLLGEREAVDFHLDEEPAWAGNKRYRRIVGVPLSPWSQANGGLLVKQGESAEPVELEPGDAVAMSPDLPHSGGINTTGAIRYGIYFRWLQ